MSAARWRTRRNDPARVAGPGDGDKILTWTHRGATNEGPMQRHFSLRDHASRLSWLSFAALLVACLISPPRAAAQAKFNIGTARKSVVFVKRITPGLGPAIGSGFLVSKDGLI